MVINIIRDKTIIGSIRFHGDIMRGIDIESAYKSLRLWMKYGAIGWGGIVMQDDY